MRLEASNKFDVQCDICGDVMKESAMAGAGHSAWLCYPCNNVRYESELYLYDSNVRIKETKNDSK